MDLLSVIAIGVPLLVIAIAIWTKKVQLALLSGVLACGISLAMSGTNGHWLGLEFILSAVRNVDHLIIIVFSLTIAAMVQLLHQAGDMKALVGKFASRATTRQHGQLLTVLSGLFIFFDDYANTLVVGNTMRTVTDRLKISREKLSYLVDATSAPLAAIAFVTTWIGAEVGYIADALKSAGADAKAYELFLASLPYAFYPILTLVFVLLVSWTGRDFGPMLRAEQRAVVTGQAAEEAGVEGKWWRALLAVLTLIATTLVTLVLTSGASWSEGIGAVIGDGNSYYALLAGSVVTYLLVFVLQIFQRKISTIATDTWSGMKHLFGAVAILILAWSFGTGLEALGTSDVIIGWLGGGSSLVYLPLASFLISAFVAFTTGSSWGTMAIMYAIVVPAGWELSGHDPTNLLLANAVSTVLAGAVFGDHCSPISDTTILSAMASSCDQVAHVRTQLPYAVVVATVAALSTMLSALGWSLWLCYILSIALLLVILMVIGKRPSSE